MSTPPPLSFASLHFPDRNGGRESAGLKRKRMRCAGKKRNDVVCALTEVQNALFLAVACPDLDALPGGARKEAEEAIR